MTNVVKEEQEEEDPHIKAKREQAEKDARKPRVFVRSEPNAETGTVNMTVEVKNAKSVKEAYEWARDTLETVIGKDVKAGVYEWADKNLEFTRISLSDKDLEGKNRGGCC